MDAVCLVPLGNRKREWLQDDAFQEGSTVNL